MGVPAEHSWLFWDLDPELLPLGLTPERWATIKSWFVEHVPGALRLRLAADESPW